MKKIIRYIFLIILAGGIVFYSSCKKERSCENCINRNQPPLANAGPDHLITLPTDSISLDGTASKDPDGKISEWLWTKISGPASFTIIKLTDSITKVKALVVGTYLFELKVTGNGGLSANDTVQIIVEGLVQSNRPPVANAGPDQIISLPTNAVTLNGSGSADPDNNISTYAWTKISGPSSFNLANVKAVQTQVNNLVQGIYLFELKVTDAVGLFAKDTMQIAVNNLVPPLATCEPYNRPIIDAKLVPFATLSEARTQISVASAGNKILFAGGHTSQGAGSATVDIYDITTQTWSIAKLSVPRFLMASITVGNKIYFAGGYKGHSTTPTEIPSSMIDIYDVVSNSWSTAQLEEPRWSITAATVGNKVFFAGGEIMNAAGYIFTSGSVEIYDVSTNSWSSTKLSIARKGLSATTAGNKIYFAGGNDWAVGSGVYDQIDVYDNGTNSWSTSTLFERKAHHGSIAIGDYIYWAGGELWNNFNDYETTCNVEKRDLITGTSTIVHLFQPSYANSNGQPGMKVLSKNGSFVFYTGYYQFDIYDPATDLWSIGVMTRGFDFAGVISVSNTIYIAGGGFPYTPASNQVWKLEF